MATLITKVTIQHNKYSNSYTVWTDYDNGRIKYEGFKPYPTLEAAKEAAEGHISRDNSDFISVVDSYEIK